MKTLFKFSLFALLAAGLVACGERVQVPPASYGKIVTPNGYKPELIPPSVFRLTPCITPGAICEQLLVIEASDTKIVETFRVYMPKDELVS